MLKLSLNSICNSDLIHPDYWEKELEETPIEVETQETQPEERPVTQLVHNFAIPLLPKQPTIPPPTIRPLFSFQPLPSLDSTKEAPIEVETQKTLLNERLLAKFVHILPIPLLPKQPTVPPPTFLSCSSFQSASSALDLTKKRKEENKEASAVTADKTQGNGKRKMVGGEGESPTKRPRSDKGGMTEEKKKDVRREKNREIVRKSRQRKADQLKELENKNNRLISTCEQVEKLIGNRFHFQGDREDQNNFYEDYIPEAVGFILKDNEELTKANDMLNTNVEFLKKNNDGLMTSNQMFIETNNLLISNNHLLKQHNEALFSENEELKKNYELLAKKIAQLEADGKPRL